MEDLGSFLSKSIEGFTIETSKWDDLETVGDLLALVPAGAKINKPVTEAKLPEVSADVVKLWFPTVLDRTKEKRQMGDQAIPMICFNHAGGMVANMRAFAKELDKVTGDLIINPMWVEIPGHGTRSKEKAPLDCRETSKTCAEVVAAGVLKGDRKKKFFVFGHSVGTLHAFEVTRELEKLGFSPRALIVLNRQAPQIPMDKPEDNFTKDVTDEQFIKKMSAEYGQKQLLELWKTNPTVVKAGLPLSRTDMTLLTEYRMEEGVMLDAPIISCGTSEDRPSNNEKTTSAWKEVTRGPFHHEMFKGGHFLYTDQPSAIMPWIVKKMKELLTK